MSQSQNPFSSPQPTSPYYSEQKPHKLASLGNRFLGALVDGFAGIVFVVPGYALMLIGGLNELPVLAIAGMGLLLLGAIGLFGLQIYLLATRSQTIGKYILKTQIVDVNTGEPASFVNTFLLRMIVNGLIGAIPCIGAIYSLVDIFFIFGEERRCIHDLIASTVVVDIS